ncbi:MAG: hypothetical protein ACF788_02405, partial [Novipirellula sp. JB048]
MHRSKSFWVETLPFIFNVRTSSQRSVGSGRRPSLGPSLGPSLSLIWALWLVGGLAGGGCDIPERAGPVSDSRGYPSQHGADARAKEGGVGAVSAAPQGGLQDGPQDGPQDGSQLRAEMREFQGDFEAWDAYFIGDKHVGYSHWSVRGPQDSAKALGGLVKAVLNVAQIHRADVSTLSRN